MQILDKTQFCTIILFFSLQPTLIHRQINPKQLKAYLNRMEF